MTFSEHTDGSVVSVPSCSDDVQATGLFRSDLTISFPAFQLCIAVYGGKTVHLPGAPAHLPRWQEGERRRIPVALRRRRRAASMLGNTLIS